MRTVWEYHSKHSLPRQHEIAKLRRVGILIVGLLMLHPLFDLCLTVEINAIDTCYDSMLYRRVGHYDHIA